MGIPTKLTNKTDACVMVPVALIDQLIAAVIINQEVADMSLIWRRPIMNELSRIVADITASTTDDDDDDDDCSLDINDDPNEWYDSTLDD